MNEYRELIEQRDAAFTKWHAAYEKNSRVEGRLLTEQEIEDEYQSWRGFDFLLEECRTYYACGVRGLKRTWSSAPEAPEGPEDETEDGMYDLQVVLATRQHDGDRAPRNYFAIIGYEDAGVYVDYKRALPHAQALPYQQHAAVSHYTFYDKSALLDFVRRSTAVSSYNLSDIVRDSTAAAEGDFVWRKAGGNV
jgi:hypothetical protein